MSELAEGSFPRLVRQYYMLSANDNDHPLRGVNEKALGERLLKLLTIELQDNRPRAKGVVLWDCLDEASLDHWMAEVRAYGPGCDHTSLQEIARSTLAPHRNTGTAAAAFQLRPQFYVRRENIFTRREALFG